MVAHGSPGDLQGQMRQVRKDLDAHSEEMLKRARKQLDWRSFIANHPLAIIGAAVAAGYLLAPRRLRVQSIDEKILKTNIDQAIGRAHLGSAPTAPGFLAGLASMAMGIAVREGVSLASQIVRNFLEPRPNAPGQTSSSFDQSPSAAGTAPQRMTNGDHL